MKPPACRYVRARTVVEAVQLLADHGADAKLLAGGQSLLPLMSLRLAEPEVLIDIGQLDELRSIQRIGEGLRIGALATHRALERCGPLVGDGFAVVPEAARHIGHYPIRTRGTIGGSIAHADPAAEWCMVALALGAELRVVGPRGERIVGSDGFFTSYYTTALDTDELIAEVRLPKPALHAAIVEHARRHGDFALAAACVSLDVVDGACAGATVVLGGVAPTVVRVPAAEAILVGSSCEEDSLRAASRAAATAVDPPADLHADSDHRRQLVTVLVRRALHRALRISERSQHVAVT